MLSHEFAPILKKILNTELITQHFAMVGARRFELPTPCAQGRCATRLRYAPINLMIQGLLRRNNHRRGTVAAWFDKLTTSGRKPLTLRSVEGLCGPEPVLSGVEGRHRGALVKPLLQTNA